MTVRSSYGLALFASLAFHGALAGLFIAVIASGSPPVSPRDPSRQPITSLRISFSDRATVKRDPAEGGKPPGSLVPRSSTTHTPSRQPRSIATAVPPPPRAGHPPVHPATAAPALGAAARPEGFTPTPATRPAAPHPTQPTRRNISADGKQPRSLPARAGTPASGENGSREAHPAALASSVAPTAPLAASSDPAGSAAGSEGGRSQPARLFSPLRPRYPFTARLRGWEGLVVVRLRIDRDGEVSSAVIERSSGHRALDEAALAAAKHARFSAATRNDNPVATTILLPIRFRLTSAGGE